MNGSGMDSTSPGSQRCADEIVRPNPIGEFRECRHIQSGERRALKILRPAFVQNQVFFGWYTAALTLAGRAAESIGHPALIGPLQDPDGKWFSVRGEEHVIERPFFGSEEHPAWNLDQFVSRFRRREKRKDLDESRWRLL